MEVIKSNRIGSHIHSPFVYRLVANVLFAPYPFYAFQEIKNFANGKKDYSDYQFIFRLVNYFQPQNIQVLGEEDINLKRVCSLAKQNIQFNENQSVDNECEKAPALGDGYEMVIWNNYCGTENLYDKSKANSVWVIRDMKNKLVDSFFCSLLKRPDVAITIRLDQLGIVIFNDQFQKQNFVIK